MRLKKQIEEDLFRLLITKNIILSATSIKKEIGDVLRECL
jgi:hypothetical protein